MRLKSGVAGIVAAVRMAAPIAAGQARDQAQDQAQTPARTDRLPVGQCLNLGNHLEPPAENDWGGKRLDANDFRIIARAGFQTVRIPVRWDTHSQAEPPYGIDGGWMKRVENVVDYALDADLNVILDVHHFEALHADPAANRDRLAGMWTQITTTFADRPNDRLWFEIDNEPNDSLVNANLVETLSPALAAIRQSNPTRAVIIGGENWSGIDSLATLELPDDPHIVPTFHYYEPFAFTHQGAEWVDDVPPVGREYGTQDDYDRLVRDVGKVRDYVTRTGKIPFMGETGAYEKIPHGQRVHYTAAVHAAFSTIDLGMCQWGYTNTFPFYDSQRKKWLPGMLEAIGLKDAD